MIKRLAKLHLIILTVLAASTAWSQGQKEKIFDQKKDLEQIKQEVEQGQTRLDSLKQEELGVQGSISEYDQKITSDGKVINRLGGKLKGLQKDIKAAESQLAQSRNRYDQTFQRFLESTRRFYLASRRPTEATSDDPNRELELNRRVIYLTALAGFERGNVADATDYLYESIALLDGRTGEKNRVAGLKKKKETAVALDKSRKEREQKRLQAVRRRKTEEADHLLMLQQAAQEMEAIIARLETESRPRPDNEPAPPSLFATLEGQLPAPVKGEVVETYGPKVHPITNLRSFSPGITIKAAAGRTVSAVAPGTVAYVGSLRGYGEFIILDHGDQYYTTYAGLEGAVVAVGHYVHAGDKLAKVGADGRIKFELRYGRETLDPVEWIRIDAF